MSVHSKVRVSIDAGIWDAIKAAAAVRGVSPHVYAEEALTAALVSFDSLNRVAAHAASIDANAMQISDQLQVITDFIVDLYRERARVP
ncbi:hypothetical protein [Microvirga sp. Mcv34]|uniref:hypothetical protein n=1 Tax=Microvirga sp. Mcv34 TaxID=2926016 RepID=UPI0021C7FC55|nr:hypothetical protein [Microvirga sp. Mcv34]